jgi:hypothetical protein
MNLSLVELFCYVMGHGSQNNDGDLTHCGLTHCGLSNSMVTQPISSQVTMGLRILGLWRTEIGIGGVQVQVTKNWGKCEFNIVKNHLTWRNAENHWFELGIQIRFYGSTQRKNIVSLSLYLFECFFETLNHSRFTQQWAMIFTRQVHWPINRRSTHNSVCFVQGTYAKCRYRLAI